MFLCEIVLQSLNRNQLLWRNRLACSAVNRKVGGSTPPKSEVFTVTITREKLMFLVNWTEIAGTNLKMLLCEIVLQSLYRNQLLWRNRLARSAVNRKVGGSSPPRSEVLTVTITREKLLFFS